MSMRQWTSFFLPDVIHITGDNVTILFKDFGTYDEHGRYQEQIPQEKIIRANVQPEKSEDLEDVPEGRRNRETIKIYSSDPLYTVDMKDKIQPNLVVWQDKTFQINEISDWWQEHWKAVAVRIEV